MLNSDRVPWHTDHAALTQVAQQVYPACTLVRAWVLAGGISAHMVALEVDVPGEVSTATPTPTLRRLVMREPVQAHAQGDHHAAAREHAILTCLAAAGVAAPAPLALDTSHTIFPFAYLVMDFVEGQPDFTPTHPATYVARMAAQLAHIHRIPAHHPALGELRSLDHELDSLTAPGDAAKPDHTVDAPQLRRLLAQARSHMARNAPVLLHGDFWPGNLLWQAGDDGDRQLTAVVDWEDAATGDPLADVAVTRLDMLWILGEGSMDAFTRAYQTHMPGLDYRELPYWDLFAALRALSWLDETVVDWAAWGRPDINPAHKRAGHVAFIAQASARLAAR